MIKFEWDFKKNLENKRKHKISFEEASTIFSSFPLQIFFDPEHSSEEERYIAVGYSNKNRVLLVVHCENSTGSTIRIISARTASKNEQKSAFGEKV
jgi:uncharacterized protein